MQVSWNPDLGEPFPIMATEGLEVGVSLCDCAAIRIKSDADRVLSTFNHQVIRWKYSEVGVLEFTQESEGLKIATKSSMWVLGAVVLALLLSLLPTATQSLFGIALGRTAAGSSAGRSTPGTCTPRTRGPRPH